MALLLKSPAFEHGAPIPREYTCEGRDVSPPLGWTGAPPGTRSFVLIVDDPDAPDPKAPQMTWVHWLVYNLPSDCKGLNETAADLPTGAVVGQNDWKRCEYGGPCPPVGRHRYFHKLYALDTTLSGLSEPAKADIERAMDGHILDQAELIGTYQKSG